MLHVVKQEAGPATTKDGFVDLEKGGGVTKEELVSGTNREIARSERRIKELEANMTHVEVEMASLKFEAKLARAQTDKLMKMGGGPSPAHNV